MWLVFLDCLLEEWRWRYLRTNFTNLMLLDGRPTRVRLTPADNHFRSRFAMLDIDQGQGQEGLGIHAEPNILGNARALAALHHFVALKGRIHRERKVYEFVGGAAPVQRRPHDIHHIIFVPDEGDLLALRVFNLFRERLAADEILAEIDKRTVTGFDRVYEIVHDVVRIQAAAQGAHHLNVHRGHPLAIRLHLFAVIDRRAGARQPT